MMSYTEKAEMYEKAIEAIVLGAQSYQIGSRTVTRANLADVEKLAEKYRNLAVRHESPTPKFAQRMIPHDC